MLVDRGRLAGEIDEDKSTDHRRAHAEQTVAGEVEVLDAVHVRRGAQRAVEVVRPGVVRAAQALADLALGLLDDPRAAVAADVEERARDPVLAGDDDDAVGADLARHELARLVDRGDVADADPAAEDLVDLPLEHPLIGERRGRQHRRLLDRLQRARDIARIEVELGARGRH